METSDDLKRREQVAFTTKDVATGEIQADILSAKLRGIEYVKNRLGEKK